MTQITVQLETPIRRTFRVEQVAGIFDVPLQERLRHELTAEVPELDETWMIGAIVGPSGSGKTTLARAAFGEAIWQPKEWPRGVAVVEAVANAECGQGRRDADPTIREITRVLCGVGLGSVPTWLKPYDVLSTGEKFRADLARAVLSTKYESARVRVCEGGLVVFDEFTSSLDRMVAKTTSAALAKLLRGGLVGRRSASPSHPTEDVVGTAHPTRLRFVAVTGHEDILPWLSPDWILRLGGPDVAPRLIRQRPARRTWKLLIERVPQATWARFATHHYLAGSLAASATCYAARCENCKAATIGRGAQRNSATTGRNAQEKTATTARGFGSIAFCAVVAALGWKKTKRITRLVVLPEFQGLGLGGRLLDDVAAIEASNANRVTITASHPAVLAHCAKSAQWRLIGMKKNGSTRQRFAGREVGSSVGRTVASFEFLRE
jgi:ABC-type ATPase involved in cell division